MRKHLKGKKADRTRSTLYRQKSWKGVLWFCNNFSRCTSKDSAIPKEIWKDFFVKYVESSLSCRKIRLNVFHLSKVILPALFIVISQLTTMSINLTLPEPAIVLSPWLYGQSNTDFFANRNSAGYWLHQYKADMMNGTGLGVRCMAGNPLGYFFLLQTATSVFMLINTPFFVVCPAPTASVG